MESLKKTVAPAGYKNKQCRKQTSVLSGRIVTAYVPLRSATERERAAFLIPCQGLRGFDSISSLTLNLYSKGVKKKYLTPCFLYGKVSKVIDVEEKLQQAYLYDFYGELLNEHQRRIYEDFVFNDLSLGEIAGEEGITRQGVADMIKRCGKKLSDYEKKLHLVEKFLSVKQDVEEIHRLAEQFHQTKDEQIVEQIATISNQILEEL